MLVASDQALRIARVAERKGWVFPDFDDDPVRQWAVEEALMLRLQMEEIRQAEEERRRVAVAEAERRVKDALEQRRLAEL